MGELNGNINATREDCYVITTIGALYECIGSIASTTTPQVYSRSLIYEIVHFRDFKRSSSKTFEYDAHIFVNDPVAIVQQDLPIELFAVPIFNFKLVDE